MRLSERMPRRVPLSDIRPDPRMLERVLGARSARENVPDIATYEPGDEAYIQDVKTAHEQVAMLVQSAADVPPIKAVRGSAYDFARSVLLHTDADWQSYAPHITRPEIAEFSKEILLADLEARQHTMERHELTEEDCSVLKPRYTRHIEHLAPAYQHLFSGDRASVLLDEPPYHKQINGHSCSTSCYRMMFSGITGGKVNPPEEYALNAYASDHDHFDEGALFRTLSSEHFKQLSGRTVLNRIIIGATFDDIALRATKVKQAHPEASIYTMVGIKCFDMETVDGLHAVILLDADDEKVTFHNPKDRRLTVSLHTPWKTGGVGETLGRKEFVARWASSLFTAHMVFAMPPKQ